MHRTVLLFLVAASAHAQVRFQTYTTDNGLPHNSVLAIRQAKDGYVWFTTYRGLVRFDGAHFQVFDSSNTPAIRGTNFATFSLTEDRHGALWAGAWNSGALRYQNGVFSAFTTKNGLPNNRVVRIDEDAQGTIWIFTRPGLSRIRNGRVEVVSSVDGEPIKPYLNPPSKLGIDPYLFGLWRLDRSGLRRFAYGKWSAVPLPTDVDPATVRIGSLLEDSQRRLWFSIIGRPRESFCVEDGRLTTIAGLPAGSFVNYRDRLGRLWITDHAAHTALWEAGRATPLDGVSTALRFAVIEDTQGNFWVGTLNNGLAYSIKRVISSLVLPGGPEANTIGSILQDEAGDVWAGSYGLSRIHGGHVQRYPQPRVSASWHEARSISSLWADRDGGIFYGQPNGVGLFKQGKYVEPDRPLREIKSEVNTIWRDRAGSLWLGTEEGLYRYRDGKLTLLNLRNVRFRGTVRVVHEDRSGTLWIGTDDVLCRYRNGAAVCFGPDDELSQWRVRSITVDADNVVWVATADRGVLRIEGESFHWIEKKDGLYTNDAAAILEDANGYFWISSQLGIYRVKKEELNEFARGRIDRVDSTFFGKSDGLNASNCTGHGTPRGFVAKDGTLWFPTAGGLATIDPKTIPFDSSPPKIQLASCSLEQKSLPCREEISLPPDTKNFEIRYSALSLVRADQVKFKYHLEGLDKTWIDAGNRSIAYYPHLSPGTYRFAVTAANSDGVWSPSASELRITVQPHYYQSIWFQWLAIVLTIGAFLFAWRLRAIQFDRRQAWHRAFTQQVIASQETERKRIAGELHDGLQQRLGLIKNMALLGNRSAAPEHHEQMEAIASEVSQALSDVRQISHNLRPYQLDLLGLATAMEVLTTRTCQTAGMRAHVAVDDLADVFPKEMEIHLYRVLQECLNNSVKHANATLVTVVVKRTPNMVWLTVTDNGAGFALPHGNGNGASGGFGLKGIFERAQLLGGKATILSTPGQGTTVSVEIPQRLEQWATKPLL